ncbi:hypothetical protein MRX96_031982 [Rhipicephalus microplus]
MPKPPNGPQLLQIDRGREKVYTGFPSLSSRSKARTRRSSRQCPHQDYRVDRQAAVEEVPSIRARAISSFSAGRARMRGEGGNPIKKHAPGAPGQPPPRLPCCVPAAFDPPPWPPSSRANGLRAAPEGMPLGDRLSLPLTQVRMSGEGGGSAGYGGVGGRTYTSRIRRVRIDTCATMRRGVDQGRCDTQVPEDQRYLLASNNVTHLGTIKNRQT